MSALDPYADLTECTYPGCWEGDYQDDLSDNDGWAHGIEHVHVIDLWMVRETDLARALTERQAAR